jgi:SM-20-related protein
VPDLSALAAIAATLCRESIAVRDEFLDPPGVAALAECAAARAARGEFTPARIGPGPAARRHEAIRGDSICWLTAPLFAPESQLLAALESLRLAVNREALLGLFDLELHYARYPPGARYDRHVDQPRSGSERQVSVVLYLNAEWHPGDGGALRVFDSAGEGFLDIEPRGGRLVCFLTAGCEHAVLPSQRLRASLSGWFRRRAA